MKLNPLLLSLASAACLALPHAQAQSTAEAADKAFTMAAKYSARGYYITPSKEGFAGFATTLEFTLPVNAGLDYVFILAGDRFALDTDVWIESEFGNTIVKDTRKVDNGLCGVSWRSDYNGTATVVVHFAKVRNRCGWAAVVGRRSTAATALPGTATEGATGEPAPKKEPAPDPAK